MDHVEEEYRQRHGHLKDCAYFASDSRREFFSADKSKSHHSTEDYIYITAYDNSGQPDWYAVWTVDRGNGKNDKRYGHEDFVSHRIEESTEIGLLLKNSRNSSVKKVS